MVEFRSSRLAQLFQPHGFMHGAVSASSGLFAAKVAKRLCTGGWPSDSFDEYTVPVFLIGATLAAAAYNIASSGLAGLYRDLYGDQPPRDPTGSGPKY